jgi:cyclic pyranopterin phosphate synthase
MKDRFERQITYLRLSVTERCNLRCRYCMPDEGLSPVGSEHLLTPEEIEKVARAGVQVGVQKIRLTGGEPTLRSDIVEIIRRLSSIDGMQELVMTTNGIRLPHLADPLVRAGLRRVNIHLDSLKADHMARLCGLPCLDRVWAGIEAAQRAGLVPIKLNMVVVRGYNEEDVVDIARLTLKRDWQVRFIELMPLGEPAQFAIDNYVSSQETMARIEAALGRLLPLHDGNLVGEARLYRLIGGRGSLGFISPVSHSYCDCCNHIRVTADGRIRPCLLLDDELNLRQVLRDGGSESDLVALFGRAIINKPKESQLGQGVFPGSRPMARIGG